MSDFVIAQAVDGASLKRDTATLLMDYVKQFMVDVLHDRLFHAEIVASGPFQFRHAFAKEFGPLFLNNRLRCDQLADVTHRFFVGQWRSRYRDVTSPTFDDLNAAQFLDTVNIPSPPTAQEIEDAWTVDIGSSDAAMHRHYVGSARTRTGKDAFSSFWHRTPDEIKKSQRR